MALEASDRLIDIIWVNWRCTYGCISRPTFKLSASLLDIMGKHLKICQISQNKSGSSLGAIFKCLKVPRLSVQTIVRKYKHNGTTQPWYHSGRRHVLSPWDESTLVQKVQINPRKTAKDPVKMLEETGKIISISTIKQVLLDKTWKAAQQGRSHCSKTAIKLNIWRKIAHFGEISSGLMKQK